MRLDMISRRRFLKSAGAAALAVAAAGVLAGCDGGDSSSKVPGTDTPNVPEVTSKQVKIIFADVNNGGAGIGNGGDYYEHPVLKDATVVDPTTIPVDKFPEGYDLADATPVEIIDNGNMVFAKVPVKKGTQTPLTEEVEISLMDMTKPTQPATIKTTATIQKGATTVMPKQIKMPEGYEFYGNYKMDQPFELTMTFVVKKIGS